MGWEVVCSQSSVILSAFLILGSRSTWRHHLEYSQELLWSRERQLPALGCECFKLEVTCITSTNLINWKVQYLICQEGVSEWVGESHSIMSNSLWPHGLYSPWNSPGQNTGVGSLSLLQGIFLAQELNQSLLHGRKILYQLSYQGSQKG